jgi:hypothetical protein
MTRTRRLTLVNSVLTTAMTYFLTIFDPPKWLIKKIDRLRRGFLWCGEKVASGESVWLAGNKCARQNVMVALVLKTYTSLARPFG